MARGRKAGRLPGEPMTEECEYDPLLGQTIYDYRIEAKLAHGGMGAVYLCRHKELPAIRKVLKVVLADLLKESDEKASLRSLVLERFEREADVVSRLHHRYIAPIDGIAVVAGQRCILMPYLEGLTLEQVLHQRGGILSPHEALHVAVQIARALDYAHRHGVVHRDLKPANIFVTPTEDDILAIKVIDFGIARQIHRVSTTSHGPHGTLHYMAVEQFEHPGDATPASDIYSLAIMIYEMTTGGYPWGTHENPFSLYERQLHDPPDPAPPGTMPVGWEEVLASALTVDPRQRPQSMRALVYPLALLLPASAHHKSGREILRTTARKWADSCPSDETLRGTPAVTGAWFIASSSGSWAAPSAPNSESSLLPIWPAATYPEAPLQSATSALVGEHEIRAPAILPALRLALLGVLTAVLTAVLVSVTISAIRARLTETAAPTPVHQTMSKR